MTILDSRNADATLRDTKLEDKTYQKPPVSAYKSTGVKILLAVTLQVMILTSFAAKRAYTINTGTVVTLRAHTFDPFDPFRGDYVNLKYDIAELPEENRNSLAYDYVHARYYTSPLPSGKRRKLEYNNECYTVLKKHSPYWTLVGIYKEKPELKDSEIMLKGKVGYDKIQYGIEQFFVPEGTGNTLDKIDRLKVEVAVDNTGCAMVKSVVPE
jgi:uncharacterized membrane-anchored protein